MARKRVTQKGREKRVVKPAAKRGAKAKAPAKRGARASAAAKAARSSAATRARARKPTRRATPKLRAASAAGTDVELEAAVLRRLLQHFDERKDVQNIELMILAGFCRNCLSRWMLEAAQERGVELDMDGAREKIYGMPYSEWKERHQPPATDEQLARFAEAEKRTAERAAKGPTQTATKG